MGCQWYWNQQALREIREREDRERKERQDRRERPLSSLLEDDKNIEVLWFKEEAPREDRRDELEFRAEDLKQIQKTHQADLGGMFNLPQVGSLAHAWFEHTKRQG